MVKTPAERKREQREREAAKEGQTDEALEAFIRTDFSTTWASNPEHEVSFIAETLGSVGLDYLDFPDNTDPELEAGLAGVVANRGALGRAERVVDALIDSATALAGIINRFKLKEIELALADIAKADLSDPAIRRKAHTDLVRLEGMKGRLSREFRRSFPAITLRGGATTN